MLCCPKGSSVTHISQKTGKRLKHPGCASNKTGRPTKRLKRCGTHPRKSQVGFCCPKGASITTVSQRTGKKMKRPGCAMNKSGRPVKRLKRCK